MDVIEGTLIGQGAAWQGAAGAAFTEGLARILIGAQLVSLLFVVGLLCAAHHPYLYGTVRRLRCFRCAAMRREVEVEFVERWLLGVRRSSTPVRCSAFERPTAIACGHRCTERAFRTQWDWALPAERPGGARQ